MRESPYDLWGEVIVTWEDVRRWMVCVPRMDPDTKRARRYITDYDVPSKIRRAKVEGTFDHLSPPGFPTMSAAMRLPWLFSSQCL
jgi:hypothetical protein